MLLYHALPLTHSFSLSHESANGETNNAEYHDIYERQSATTYHSKLRTHIYRITYPGSKQRLYFKTTFHEKRLQKMTTLKLDLQLCVVEFLNKTITIWPLYVVSVQYYCYPFAKFTVQYAFNAGIN